MNFIAPIKKLKSKMLSVLTFAFMITAFAAGSVKAAEYQIDPIHSEVSFKVKHLGISTVMGKFENVSGTFSVDPKNIKDTKGQASIDVNSITTSNGDRDKHLKGPDFFDVANFPSIGFKSKEVKDINETDSTCTLVGDLTMHGITKEIYLKVKGGGILAKDPWGNERAAFTATGRINRFDFGLKWNKAMETGGLVVSPEVDLVLGFEGMRKLEVPGERMAGKPGETKAEKPGEKTQFGKPAANPAGKPGKPNK